MSRPVRRLVMAMMVLMASSASALATPDALDGGAAQDASEVPPPSAPPAGDALANEPPLPGSVGPAARPLPQQRPDQAQVPATPAQAGDGNAHEARDRATEAPAGEPIAPSVAVVLAEPSPVIGLTGETALSIEVSNPPVTPMPMPRVLCSIGQIEDLGREGPARFSARYILPTSRYPQPAILVAEFFGGGAPLRGATRVRLRAAATPSFRTAPGARVTLRVDDREFGPQVAAADGSVHVPVVVPPGVAFAVARSMNEQGKATEQVIDLHVPYSQRLLVAAPERLSAGSVGEVAVYAVEPSGRPASAGDLILRGGYKPVQPLGSPQPGEARFLVTAPTILRQKSMRVEAQLRGQSTTVTATRIALVPGPATGLLIEPEAPRLDRKLQPLMRVFLGAEDAFGNPVDAGHAGVLVDGQPASVKADTEGQPTVIVHVPSPAAQRDEVTVEGVLDEAHTSKHIPVRSSPKPTPAKPPIYLPFPRYTITPRLGILTNVGPLAGATFFVDGSVAPSAVDRGLGLGISVGIIQSRFAAESASGITRTDLSTLPLAFQIRQHVVLDRVVLGVGVAAGFALAFTRVHAYDATTVGHSFGATAEASLEVGVLLHNAHLVASLRYLGLYLADFSTGDHLSGNAGGLLADLGYRRGW